MKRTQLIAFTLLLCTYSTIAFLNLWGKKQVEIVQDAKNQMTIWQKNTNWDSCYKDAVYSLTEGCKTLQFDDTKRSRIAVNLANCHLAKSGLRTYPCTDDMSLQDCTKDMLTSPVSFQAYTEFVTHVDNICFYIQADMFQEIIEAKVKTLMDQTDSSARQLNSMKSKAEEIQTSVVSSITKQQEALDMQDKMQSLLNSMNEQEKQRFRLLEKEFQNINSKTQGLGDQLTSLSQAQVKLAQQHDQMKKVSEDFLEELKKNNKNLAENLLSTLGVANDISSIQSTLKNDVTSIKEKQEEMGRGVSKSLGIQDKLIQQQTALQNAQQHMHQETRESLQTIEQKSDTVQEKLKQAMTQQEELAKLQKLTEEHLKQLKAEQEDAFAQAKRSISELLAVADDTSAKLYKHHQDFLSSYSTLFATVEKILNFHSSILGEFLTIKAIFYYICNLVISILITSTKRTHQARLWILLLLLLSFGVERHIIVKYSPSRPMETIHTIVDLARAAFMIIQLITLTGYALTYQDLEQVNHQLLKQVISTQRATWVGGAPQMRPYTPMAGNYSTNKSKLIRARIQMASKGEW